MKVHNILLQYINLAACTHIEKLQAYLVFIEHLLAFHTVKDRLSANSQYHLTTFGLPHLAICVQNLENLLPRVCCRGLY